MLRLIEISVIKFLEDFPMIRRLRLCMVVITNQMHMPWYSYDRELEVSTVQRRAARPRSQVDSGGRGINNDR